MTISSVVGRRAILALILLGFIASFGVFWWVGRGGAISFPTAAPAIKKLLEHYVPLLAILAGFYFSERTLADKGSETSIEAFVFALVVVAIWVLGPPILIAASETIEGALRLLDSVAVIGTSLASLGLAFYFSKGGKGSAR